MASNDAGGRQKPAGRLQTAQDVRAAITELLERLRELRGERRASASADKAWPEDLNAPPSANDRREEDARG